MYFESENSQDNEVSYVFVFTPTLVVNIREIVFCMIEFDFELSTLNWISL